MTSATQGLGQAPEGLVTNAQSSVPANMGLNLSGVNTGSHNMPVLPMDQTDNTAVSRASCKLCELYTPVLSVAGRVVRALNLNLTTSCVVLSSLEFSS